MEDDVVNDWDGDDCWEEAVDRSADFKKFSQIDYGRKILDKIIGTSNFYMKQGDKAHLSIWAAIAGLNKHSTQQRIAVEDKIDDLRETVYRIECEIEDSEGTPYSELKSEVAMLRSRTSESKDFEDEEELLDDMEPDDFSEGKDLGSEGSEVGEQEKEELTENQRELLDVARDNREADLEVLAEMTGYNLGNAAKAARHIREKGHSLPENLSEIG